MQESEFTGSAKKVQEKEVADSDSATNKRWREDWAGLMPLWTASDQEVDLRGDSRNSSREKKGRRRHAKKAPQEDHAAGPRTSKNAR
jgi:hypothetical protein